MPKLRSLSGKELLKIFEQYGFEVIRIRGSHYRLRRTIEGKNQFLTIPVHGKKPLRTGTLRAIYRQALQYLQEDELMEHFYG